MKTTSRVTDGARENDYECDDNIYNVEVPPLDFSFPRQPHLSDVIWNGLLYSQEDVNSSSNFVLLCPYERHEDGTTVFLETDDGYDCHHCPLPEEIMESNIMEVFDAIPGNDPPWGDFQNQDYEFDLRFSNRVLIMYTAYLIVKQASPRLKPYMIHRLLGISGVGEYDEQVKDWQCMLTQEGKADEEMLYDAWRGHGNMWVFVRPDRFPIAETLAANPLLVVSGHSSIEINPHRSSGFDALPLDILLLVCQLLPVKSTHMLLCTNRCLRSQILPYANMIAYQQIITYERHLLPAGPFELDRQHGREEVDWWDAEWSKGGIHKEEFQVNIPWFIYRRECSKSMSMWNRWRIWGIAEQLERLAIDRGFLSAEA
ncbi:hypothetical protein BYT27DRAFT_7263192 [Phlegmacium glaucopus]|nr:hypothetical protein BYT27DRAFT_7263192 [Phlegmacium glaucopus]